MQCNCAEGSAFSVLPVLFHCVSYAVHVTVTSCLCSRVCQKHIVFHDQGYSVRKITMLVHVCCNFSVWRWVPWWFNYPGPLHSTGVELTCLSGERRLCLCIIFKDSACPAELPRGSVGRASTWYAERRGFKSCLRQLFFFS